MVELINLCPAIIKPNQTAFESKLSKSLWKRLDESFYANLQSEGGEFTPKVSMELKAVLMKCLEAYPDFEEIVKLTAQKYFDTVLKSWHDLQEAEHA